MADRVEKPFPHPALYVDSERLALIKGYVVHEQRTPARPVLVVTPHQTIGPFFHFALTPDATMGCMVGSGVEGERIRLACRVWDGERAPVTDAMIELWQADIGGFGRLATDEHGMCVFETVRSPHVDVWIFARGLTELGKTVATWLRGDRPEYIAPADQPEDAPAAIRELELEEGDPLELDNEE